MIYVKSFLVGLVSLLLAAVVCGRTWSAPSHLLLAKAAVAWEEIDHMHQASTRRRGYDTFGRSHTVKARTVRWTSRGWHKRRRPLPTASAFYPNPDAGNPLVRIRGGGCEQS
jgi:hypothetical protein